MRFLETPQSQFLAALSVVGLGLGTALALQRGWGTALAFLVLGIALVLINLHDLDCLIKGDCQTYTWSKAAVLGVLVLFFIAVVAEALQKHQRPFAQLTPQQVLDPDQRRRALAVALKENLSTSKNV